MEVQVTKVTTVHINLSQFRYLQLIPVASWGKNSYGLEKVVISKYAFCIVIAYFNVLCYRTVECCTVPLIFSFWNLQQLPYTVYENKTSVSSA